MNRHRIGPIFRIVRAAVADKRNVPIGHGGVAGFDAVEPFKTAKLPRQFVTPSISFKGGYTVGYNMVTFTENISLGKRVYEADEWPAFRNAVMNQRAYMDNPVVFLR